MAALSGIFVPNIVPYDAQGRIAEEELRRIIRDAGFIPKQRDTLYRTYFLN